MIKQQIVFWIEKSNRIGKTDAQVYSTLNLKANKFQMWYNLFILMKLNVLISLNKVLTLKHKSFRKTVNLQI